MRLWWTLPNALARSSQHVLNRWSSADIREGHFFNTRYGIWSRGLGHDAGFDLESTRVTSSTVNAAVSIGTKGAGASGIHDGLGKVLGTEEYTSVSSLLRYVCQKLARWMCNSHHSGSSWQICVGCCDSLPLLFLGSKPLQSTVCPNQTMEFTG